MQEDVYNKMPCIQQGRGHFLDESSMYGCSVCFIDRLHIVSDTSDDFSAYECVSQPQAYSLLANNARPTSPPEITYMNPFRLQDVSLFPLDLQQRLAQLPIIKQIAILKHPELQEKYFPEYCQPPYIPGNSS